MTTIGVLALQGDVREHEAALARLGVASVRVRRLSELEAVDGIIIPGGESTTIDKLLRAFDLFDPLQARIREGLPVLGTCAGMIMLATDIIGGIDGQRTLGAIDMTVRRNAFGRQVDSSEVELTWLPDGSTMHATFIRAPWVESCGARRRGARGRCGPRRPRGRGAAGQRDRHELPLRDLGRRQGPRTLVDACR